MGQTPVSGLTSGPDLVTVSTEDGVAVVTLNRPGAMNALSRALRGALAAVMIELDTAQDVRVVILTGAGDRAFTAGLDLKELGADTGTLAAASSANAQQNPVMAIERCRKPVIGAINGVAITGGFEVALACDILIGSTNARFADTHVRVGIMPGWGLSQKLSRIIGINRALEMSLSGNFLDAATAQSWGLLNRVVAPEALMPAALQLARDIASADPAMVQAYKGLIKNGYAVSLAEGLAKEQHSAVAVHGGDGQDDFKARLGAVMSRGRSQQETKGSSR